MSEKAKPTSFSPTAYVLMAIVFACVIFVGEIQGTISHLPIAGLALFIFVVIPHWIGRKVATKMGATPATIIISMFASFWTFLSICWMLSGVDNEILDWMKEVLKLVEPLMMGFISIVAITHYLRSRDKINLGVGLLVGLNGAIAWNWLPLIGVHINKDFTSWWLAILGTWAFVTCFLVKGTHFLDNLSRGCYVI